VNAVRVGLVGTGFTSHYHMRAYSQTYGVPVQVVAVASLDDSASAFAKTYHIPTVYRDYQSMMDDPGIDVVDILTTVNLRASLAKEFLLAGKHVICEKPLTGYFGSDGDPRPVGHKVPKRIMYERVLQAMDELHLVIQRSGRLFMYGENWIYAPTVQKCEEILRATQDKILFIKAEESHSGNRATYAARWDMTGGGALLRQGCHGASSILYLKRVEQQARHEQVVVTRVIADVGYTAGCLLELEKDQIFARPVDVEDWGILNLTFSDGTKATVLGGDMVLGGVRDYVEVYTNAGAMVLNMSPNNTMLSYLTDKSKLVDVNIMEKEDLKTGWQYVSIREDWTRGFIQEIQDFMECIAYGRHPVSDFGLAYDTIQAIYAGYVSADEGVRVEIGH
jgi:predicted dehydrogenase